MPLQGKKDKIQSIAESKVGKWQQPRENREMKLVNFRMPADAIAILKTYLEERALPFSPTLRSIVIQWMRQEGIIR